MRTVAGRLGTAIVVEDGVVAGLVAVVWEELVWVRIGLWGKEARCLEAEGGSSSSRQRRVASAVVGRAVF